MPIATAQSQIAFVRGTTNIHGDLIGDIYVMNADGSGRRRLTRNPADDSQPAWAPDGRKIVFRSERPIGSDGFSNGLFIMNSDGSTQRRLTRDEDGEPAWSPDGTRIAYYRSVCPKGSLSNCQSEIYVMNADGSGPRRLTRNREDDTSPAWSPDSHSIAFVRSGDMWVMNADGMNQRRLTRTSPEEDAPDWSPDGNRISFAKARSPGPGDVYFAGDIWVMNVDGSHPRRLTTSRGPETDPAWSPDGSEIAFERGTPPGSFGYVLSSQIVVMNTDGTAQHTLTRKPNPRVQVLNVEPTWQPKIP